MTLPRKLVPAALLAVAVLAIGASGYLMVHRHLGTSQDRRLPRATVTVAVSPVTGAGALKPGFTVKATIGHATCLAASEAMGNGYRCFAQHGVYDPCWAEAANPSAVTAVICMLNPWDHQATRLLSAYTLEPLPAHDPAQDTFPWGLTLADGNQCVAVQGTHDHIYDRVIDYTCDAGLYVLRGLNRTQPLWRAPTARSIGTGYSIGPTVAITKVWYGQPAHA